MTLSDDLPPHTYSVNTGSLIGAGLHYPSRATPLLDAALIEVQAEVGHAGKSGDNKFDKYTYAKLEDFMHVGKPLLAKKRLALTFEVTDVIPLPDRQTKNGGQERAILVRGVATLIHESGQERRFPGYGEGQDRADKAIYKAMTGAKKYAWAGVLAIPTSDDPEADEKVGLSARGAKTDSQGVAKTKIPKWTSEQITQAGTLNKKVLDALTLEYDGNAAPAEEELGNWKHQHKYDDPALFLSELTKWVNELEGRP